MDQESNIDYNARIAELSKQLRYQKLLTQIEKQKAKRAQYLIIQAQIYSQNKNESELRKSGESDKK